MDDKFRLELELTGIEEEKEDSRDDHEFYETIEAPKFVDFTRPNHFCPDDRYWFCSRVGCNQKHEEEMDSEAIYKNFVLRVMAARSPNVRFQRALTRKPPSDSKKCPLSAPPKPSKSRIPRLALVSSIPKKLIDDHEKGTNKPTPAKPASTPKARVRHVPAKYMTSPRKKNASSPNVNAFKSVSNPKKTSITIQKTRVVAKALLFSSPKKAVKVKRSELGTSVTKLCEGIKKLAIKSEKKGIDQKPFKESTSVRKLLPSDVLRKQPSVDCKAKASKSVKSSKCVKFKAKQHDEKHEDSVFHEARSGDDSSDMEIEESRAGSLGLCSEIVKSGIEVKSDQSSSSEGSLTAGSSDGIFSEILTTELICVTDSEERCSEQQNTRAFQELNATVKDRGNKSYTTNDDLENQNLDNNEKENVLNTSDIRLVNGNNPSKHGVPVKSKVKKTRKLQNGVKPLEDNCSEIITQGVKYKKLKPTNPKPFRLRTDERGILKEATLERKVNSHGNSTTTSENSQYTENGASATRVKAGKKVEGKTLKKVHFIPVESKYMKTLKEAELLSERATVPCSENRTGRTTSFLCKELVQPQRETGSQVKPRRLNVTEETVTTMSKESSKQDCKKVAVATSKASAAHKLAAQRRKPTTVPREPKFHTLSTQKTYISF